MILFLMGPTLESHVETVACKLVCNTLHSLTCVNLCCYLSNQKYMQATNLIFSYLYVFSTIAGSISFFLGLSWLTCATINLLNYYTLTMAVFKPCCIRKLAFDISSSFLFVSHNCSLTKPSVAQWVEYLTHTKQG